MAQQKYDTAEAQNVMREIFDGRVYMQFEVGSVLWNLWPDAEAEFVHDKGMEWAVYLEPNPSMAAIGDGGVMPRGSTSKKRRMKVTYATFTLARRLTGQVLYTDRNSIIKGLTPLMKEDSEVFTKALNRLAYGTGDGSLATAQGAPAGTADVVMSGSLGSQLIYKRGAFNIVDPAAGTKRTITVGGLAYSTFYAVTNAKSTATVGFSVDEGAATSDVISATTIQAGGSVVMDGSWGLNIHGLGYHGNNTGTYQNLSRTTYSDTIVPPIKDARNGPLTVALMDWLETKVIFAKGTQHNMASLFWLTSPTQIYAYRTLGYNTDTKVMKQFAGTDVKLDLGWQVLEHNGRQMLPDVDCPPDIMDLLQRDSFRKLMAKQPGIIDDNGQTLYMVPAYDSSGNGSFKWEYVYFMATLADIANKDILSSGFLKGLSTDNLPTASN